MMPDFQAANLLDEAGRLQYNQLLTTIRQVARSVFVDQFIHPILVGTSLYQGDLLAAAMKDMTMGFNFQDLEEEKKSTEDSPDPTGLKRAVYPLIKKRLSTSSPYVYTMGRIRGNDMIMADFAVSRKHAQIRISNDQYFLTDLESTNGCTINGERIPPNEEREFREGDEIGFARYRFHFIGAGELYDRFRDL